MHLNYPVWERALAAFSLNYAVSVAAALDIFRDDYVMR